GRRGLPRALDPGKGFGEATVAVRPHDQVHVRRLVEQRLAHPLRHAPGHPDHEPGALPLQPVELRDPAQHALLRMVTDRAGVDQDDVRLLRRIDELVPARREDPLHELAVRNVHLAPVRLDVRALRSVKVVARGGRVHIGPGRWHGHGSPFLVSRHIALYSPKSARETVKRQNFSPSPLPGASRLPRSSAASIDASGPASVGTNRAPMPRATAFSVGVTPSMRNGYWL